MRRERERRLRGLVSFILGKCWVSRRDVMVLERRLTLMVYLMVDRSTLDTRKIHRRFQSL